MSVKCVSMVWQHSSQKGSPLLVLLAIADYANDSGVSWPGLKALARKSRLSKRSVQYILKKLYQSKELSIRESKGPHGTHLYYIHFDAMLPKAPLKEDEETVPPDDLSQFSTDLSQLVEEGILDPDEFVSEFNAESQEKQSRGENISPPKNTDDENSTNTSLVPTLQIGGGEKIALCQSDDVITTRFDTVQSLQGVQDSSQGCNPLHGGGATGCTQTVIEPSIKTVIKQNDFFDVFGALKNSSDLEDTAIIVRIHEKFCQHKKSPVRNNDAGLLDLLALAVHCLALGKPIENPIGLFISRSCKGDFRDITESQDVSAENRLRLFRKRGCSILSTGHSEEINELVEQAAKNLVMPKELLDESKSCSIG